VLLSAAVVLVSCSRRSVARGRADVVTIAGGGVDRVAGVRTSRRSALALGLGGGALLGVGLSGCDAGGPDGPDGSPTDDGAPGAEAADEGDDDGDADRALVDDVLGEVDALLGAVLAAQQAFPGLQVPLAGLEQMHRAHRAALAPDDDAAAAPSTSPAPARARAALRGVRAGENAHEQALTAAALAAASGALARLLASMSASVAQHLAVLPTRPAGRA
jgi:hypothetical protein